MVLDGRNVLVVGAGRSGLAAARFCARKGARVTVTDVRKDIEPSISDVRWELGGHVRESFLAADLIVLSPGVPPLQEVAAARAKGIAVVGEIELASQFISAPVVAITGTNGKSTVTALAGCIAEQSGRPIFVGGNLGTPLIEAVDTPAAGAEGLVVVELSSFQLETCETFRPRAAALLNLTPDHLDRYATVEEYGRAKLRIAQRMTKDDVLVVNADDAFFADRVRGLPTSTVFYSSLRDKGCTGYITSRDLVLRGAGIDETYPLELLQLIGRHNQGNALAALLLIRLSELVTFEQAGAGLAAFRALPHRMQLIGEREGVRYYDDSKATNVDSVVAGLDGFPTPFALIAGGRDKGGSYEPLIGVLRKSECRGVVLIGEAAEKIASALANSAIAWIRAPSMDEAVERARQLVQEGGAVVLSPACSSFDMFKNYAHRGDMFRRAVEALA